MCSSDLENMLSVIRAVFWLCGAYVLSGTRSFADFVTRCGLMRQPTFHGWIYACVAIGVSLLGKFASINGWTSGSSSGGYAAAGGNTYEFYVILVCLIGPFYEEVTTKGFFYAALRARYGPVLSTAAIIAFLAYFHRYSLSHSIVTPLCLGALWILTCLARENTSSVWDCIICHSAYNASQMFGWTIYVLGMVMILPVCQGRASHLKSCQSSDV